MNRRQKLAVAASLVGAIALAGCSSGGSAPEDETDFPESDITFIVPFPAGSGPDAAGRIIAQGMEDDLGVPVIVENREGGAQTIGMFELSNAAPDGYTVGFGSIGISLQSRLIENPFQGLETLTPIAQVKTPHFVLFGSPDRGWDSIEAFIADAKANPGMTVGVPNTGSVPDMLVRYLEEEAGLELKHVSYDAGQQVLPVVNGTVDLGVAQAAPVVQFVGAGRLAFIGVLGAQEPPTELDVPMFAGEGYHTDQIVDYEGIFGPAGIPEDVVARLSEAIRAAVESDEYQELMTTTFSTGTFLDGEEFSDFAFRQDEAAEENLRELGLID